MKEEDVLTTEETVNRLREVGMKISRETLRMGLEQRVFPFGDCVRAGHHPVCWIYRPLLEKWISERFAGKTEAESWTT